jgi:hypothetical protein
MPSEQFLDLCSETGVQGVYPDFTIDYSKINVASGPLPGVSDVIATPDLATTLVNLSWDTTIGVLGVAGSETDILNIDNIKS